jgi:ParB-like chromosome segregation protein Spo0J
MPTTQRVPRLRHARPTADLAADAILRVPVDELTPDDKNPRKADQARSALLRLSLAKLGYLMPLFRQRSSGLLLSGHQRLTQSKALGLKHVPVIDVDVADEEVMNINLLFNRLTNDFNAFDTGATVKERMNMQDILELLEGLPDRDDSEHYAYACTLERVRPLGKAVGEQYDKKAAVTAGAFTRMNIRIPLVVSESGKVVNGVNRLFSALDRGIEEWPVVRVPDDVAEVALVVLNYLSMDFHVDDDFKDLLRSSAFRRVSNNRGDLGKTYRFWANGCKSLLDRDSYTPEYWTAFREIHGNTILDFGAGLGKVAPYLISKGFMAYDFEPYRVDPVLNEAEPSQPYSHQMAVAFLEHISDYHLKFDSIFLSAVLNSVPFPEDRLMVLSIVNALCEKDTVVYGTCRDMSDFDYEYGGVRNGNYFVWDTEPGVRLGDVSSRPKLQKFMTQDEARGYFSRFWSTIEFWPGGNVFYFKLSNPMRPNLKALAESLRFEFDLPFAKGKRLGLADLAIKAFEKRLGRSLK